MLNVDWWWALLLLPLPLLAQMVLPTANEIDSAMEVPLLNRKQCDTRPLLLSSGLLPTLCLWLFWICLVFAACRPYWVGEPTHRTQSSRDLMLAIDISGSMQETDMEFDSRLSSRIDILKSVVSEFIKRREGDRLGLILFGTKAYTYVPLTFDRDALNEMLVDVSSGLAGRFTAIGDAIGIAIKTLGEQESRHKVLILVTDGSNTSGYSDPVKAARIAAKTGMTIHTIGVGNDDRTMRRLTFERNIPVGTALNETDLRRIADITGGRYFRATDRSSLEQIYQTLNQLEPIELNAHLHRPRSELFYLPLALGMLCLLGLFSYIFWNSYRLGKL